MFLGGPTLAQVLDPLTGLFIASRHSHRVGSRRRGGLAIDPFGADYDEFYEGVQRTVPAEQLLEWDMSQQRWEDLCGFLDIKPCPKSGPIVRRVSTLSLEESIPAYFFLALPVWLLLHWLHLCIFGPVLSFIFRSALRPTYAAAATTLAAAATTLRRVLLGLASHKWSFWCRLIFVVGIRRRIVVLQLKT
eukprot:UN3111